MKILDFVGQIVARIGRFFSPAQPEFSFDREPFSLPAIVERKRKRREPNTSKKTLAELLDNLDKTFKTMQLPRDSASWLQKDLARGLRRLGVYVPDPWVMKWTHNPDENRVDVTRKFPSMMSISFCVEDKGATKDDLVPANTMFAIKHEKLPFSVTQIPGVAYEFGYSFNFQGKNFWMVCYVSIDRKTGEIRFCDELVDEVQVIPRRNARKGQSKEVSFSTRRWKEPSLMTGVEFSTEHKKLAAQNMFRAMMTWWMDRDLRWSVGVRKGKDRVIFSVEPQNTKVYFADRDKSVKTANGFTKKIIHYVREHERVTATKTTTVREHIRGLREFDWGEYHCIVTAPAFHLTQLSSSFDASAQDVELEELDKTTVSTADMVKLLTELEEADHRGRGKVIH